MTSLSETKSHQICQKAIELKKTIEFRFLELGALLYEIKEKRHYEAGWTSWEEYQMEIGLPQSTISKLVRIYQIFILRFKYSSTNMASIGWANLAEFLPFIKEETSKKDIEDLLNSVSDQPQTEIRRIVRERKTGIEIAKCKHTDTYLLKVCRNCKDRWVVHDE